MFQFHWVELPGKMLRMRISALICWVSAISRGPTDKSWFWCGSNYNWQKQWRPNAIYWKEYATNLRTLNQQCRDSTTRKCSTVLFATSLREAEKGEATRMYDGATFLTTTDSKRRGNTKLVKPPASFQEMLRLHLIGTELFGDFLPFALKQTSKEQASYHPWRGPLPIFAWCAMRWGGTANCPRRHANVSEAQAQTIADKLKPVAPRNYFKSLDYVTSLSTAPIPKHRSHHPQQSSRAVSSSASLAALLSWIAWSTWQN